MGVFNPDPPASFMVMVTSRGDALIVWGGAPPHGLRYGLDPTPFTGICVAAHGVSAPLPPCQPEEARQPEQAP